MKVATGDEDDEEGSDVQRGGRRTVWSLLGAVAVAVLGLAVLVAGARRALASTEDLVAGMPRVGTPVVVTAPGMTELQGATLRVRAAAADPAKPVFIGVGRADDVQAHLGPVARSEVTAVDERAVLRIVSHQGQPSLPDPAGVDAWAAAVRASGVASLTWPRTPGRWLLVIATDGRQPPAAAEFTWSGKSPSSPAPALIAVGAVLAAAGVAAVFAIRSGRLFAAPVDEDDEREPAPAPIRWRRRAGLPRARAGAVRAGAASTPDRPTRRRDLRTGRTSPSAPAPDPAAPSAPPPSAPPPSAPPTAADDATPPTEDAEDHSPAVLPFRRRREAGR